MEERERKEKSGEEKRSEAKIKGEKKEKRRVEKRGEKKEKKRKESLHTPRFKNALVCCDIINRSDLLYFYSTPHCTTLIDITDLTTPCVTLPYGTLP